jgi:hypothetical protein
MLPPGFVMKPFMPLYQYRPASTKTQARQRTPAPQEPPKTPIHGLVFERIVQFEFGQVEESSRNEEKTPKPGFEPI